MLLRFCLTLFLFVLMSVGCADAQERFFTFSNHGGAEGARQSVQLQQETNRNIDQDVSLTTLSGQISAALVSLTEAQNTLNTLSATTASHATTLTSLTSAVGLGQTGLLELSGGLKLGAFSTCASSEAGVIRYEAAQRLVQFCDGTSWQEIGASPQASGNFTPVTGADLSTVTTSNAVTIAGFLGTRTASVSVGGTIIRNGTPQGMSCDISPGDTVALRVTSSSSYNSTVNVTFTVSTMTSTWTVTTRAQDTTPNSFTFTALTNQEYSTVAASNAATVSAFDGPLTATVSGQGSPQVRKNAGIWGSSVSLDPGDSLQVRLTSSPDPTTLHQATVTVGSYSTTFDVTTKAACGLAGQDSTVRQYAIMLGWRPAGTNCFAIPTPGPDTGPPQGVNPGTASGCCSGQIKPHPTIGWGACPAGQGEGTCDPGFDSCPSFGIIYYRAVCN